MQFSLRTEIEASFLLKHFLSLIKSLSNFWVICLCLAVIPFAEGSNEEKLSFNYNSSLISSRFLSLRTLNLSKRATMEEVKCSAKEHCDAILPGSLCVDKFCTCPQGFLPSSEGKIGCFQSGKLLGESCNISAQCGEDLSCEDSICTCPEGFQLLHTQGANLCLLWHRPTRLVDRCRSNEDCLPHDLNSACHKRWCQCNNGFTLFETMLFGLKHKCFKTYKTHCHKTSHCAKLVESDLYCICQFSFCHCIPNSNVSSLDFYGWSGDKPTWYQRWKKDLILATRLLFITIILFFVPCFVYVTLGVRERSRLFFSQVVQPSQSTGAHVQYSRGRVSNSHSRSLRRSSHLNSETHNVEIALGARGVNSRLVEHTRSVSLGAEETYPNNAPPQRARGSDNTSRRKQEDPPPSYDEIMRIERLRDEPPPPYQEL